MTPTAVKLPPNPIRHFYRGGPAIAELRGIDVGGDHSPEEWIGSASTLFGENERGLSRMPDGSLVRDALAADPEGWLGAAHAARFGASPALLVKLLDAGERLPVHHHPDHPFAHEHLGRDFGKTEAWIVLAARDGAEVAVGWREDVADETLRAWVDDQDHDALLGALNPVAVSAGDAVFVPAGVPHAIGAGILIVELQEPTDLSVLLEWDGFGIDDEQAATLGLGWDVALASVERTARDPSALRGPRGDGAVSELLPPAAAAFFSAQRVAPDGGSVRLPAGFAVVIVVEGTGTLAGLDVARGDALLVPHAAGPILVDGDLVAIACRPPGGAGAVTEVLLGIDVGTSACKAAAVDVHGVELAHGQTPTPWEPVPTGAEVDADALLGAVVAAAREALERAPEGDVVGIGVTSVAETGMLLDGAGTVLHRPVAWHDSRGAVEAQALARDLPDFTQRTGLPATALCSLAKLRHLGTEGAARWLNVAEWVVHRLGGRLVSELSLSSRTGLLDLEAVAPYADALAWAGLPAELLGELVLAGTEAGPSDGAALPGTEGAVLTVAGHDHLVAGVGVGVIAPGDVLDSCGTAEALVRVAPPQDAAARRRSAQAGVTVGWHVAEGRQALLAGVWSGLALREVLEQLGTDRDELSAGALAIAPGDAPALELELHSLERSPVRLPDAAPAAVWRGAIDTVTREVQALIAHIDEVAGPHTKVVVTGGWARDPAVFDAKRRFGAIEAPPVVEAGCRGAALLSGVAAGLFPSADELPAVSAIEKEPA